MEAFRTGPLEGAFPYLFLDAKHLKVRFRGHVHSKALMVAFAVHESGRREVIGIEIAESETEAGWAAFLRELRARGLDGVRLCVSDDHLGLKAAVAKVIGCPWEPSTGWIQPVLATSDRGGCDEHAVLGSRREGAPSETADIDAGMPSTDLRFRRPTPF